MHNTTLPPVNNRTLTGFPAVDEITGGLENGDLIVIAARAGVGKTTLATNIAEHVALNQKLQVAIFSIGMDSTSLARCILGSTGHIPRGGLEIGSLADVESPSLSEAIEKFHSISIHIDDTADLPLSVLTAKARGLHNQFGKLGLVVVDYLQLVNVHKPVARMFAVGAILYGLKLLAKELQCPVIVLSQVNRSVETRRDKRPMMSDLREASVLNKYVDVVMFIYRDEYYLKEASKDPGVAEIIIAKQRNGPTGTVKLTFDPLLAKFKPLGEGK